MTTDWAEEARKLGGKAGTMIKIPSGTTPVMPRVCAWCAAGATGDVKIEWLDALNPSKPATLTVTACAACLSIQQREKSREMGWYLRVGALPAVLTLAAAAWGGSQDGLQGALLTGAKVLGMVVFLMIAVYVIVPKKMLRKINKMLEGGYSEKESENEDEWIDKELEGGAAENEGEGINKTSEGGTAKKEGEGAAPAVGTASQRHTVLLMASEDPWTLCAAPGFILAMKEANPAAR